MAAVCVFRKCFNKQGQKLTRKGVAYILDKYAKQAAAQTVMPGFNITTHVFRHTKAMHLLGADVHLFYIREILGMLMFRQLRYTQARIDAEKKREVLERISSSITPGKLPQWHDNPSLMEWLKNLWKII